MSVADALRDLLVEAAELGARKALEQVQVSGVSRWIRLKESPIGYRVTLEVVRKGELHVHGVGNRKYLDREQVDAWLLAHPIATTNTEQDDSIDDLVASNRARKARRKGATK